MLVAQRNILYLSDDDKFIVEKLCWHSARMYNVCLYNIRQYFFNNNAYLPYKEQYYLAKENENYRLLLNDSSQQVVRMADKSFKSFFSLLKLKQKGKYSPDVHIPRYLGKNDQWSFFLAGRSGRVKGDKIHIGLSKNFREQYNLEQKELVLPLPKNVDGRIHQIQIKPTYHEKQYELIVTYERQETEHPDLHEDRYLSLDCGVSNLLTCYDSYNKTSFIIDGRFLKSVNQFFNKELAKLKSKCDKEDLDFEKTARFIRLSNKRKNIINECFCKVVNKLIQYCLENGIKNIVVGDFKNIKQGINHGAVNNQNFVSIPYYKLKAKLESKCKENGINYFLQEESYTSKASAVDLDEIPTYGELEEGEEKPKFSGKRIKRGLYQTKDKKLINADVNGAINILRKHLKCKSKGDLSPDDVRAASTSHPCKIFLQLDKQAAKSLA